MRPPFWRLIDVDAFRFVQSAPQHAAPKGAFLRDDARLGGFGDRLEVV